MITSTNASPTAPNFYYAISGELDGTVTGVLLNMASAEVPTLWVLEIDNTLNAVPVYVKLWADVSAAVTIGSTAPTMQFAAPASKKQTYSFAGSGPSLALGVALMEFSWACVLEPGTPGTASPVAAVPVRILFKQDP